MVHITLSFNYPWNDCEATEYEIQEALSELSPSELLIAAEKYGQSVRADVEVY